jgi:hypothetical protein
MNKQPKTARKPKTTSNLRIRDLKPEKDPKGGIIAVLIGFGTSPPPSPPPPPPTTK